MNWLSALSYRLSEATGKVMTMKIITKKEVRKMTYRQRIMNYEMEKKEILDSLKVEHDRNCSDALEALREKWMV